MKLARGIEKRLENLVDGVSASVFRGRLHPVAIASRLLRQLDFLAEESAVGPQVPNDLTVVLHPADLDPSLVVADLEHELATAVTVAARVEGWRLIGPVEVHIETSDEVPRGVIQCAGDMTRGRMEPWAQLIAEDASAVVPISMNRTLIGRALECDVRIPDANVSRHHATIVRMGDAVHITDLGSSNGTYVNGDRISDVPVMLVPGAQLVIGGRPFTYRMVA